MSNHAPVVIFENRSHTARRVDDFPTETTDAEFRYGPDAIYIRPLGPGIEAREATSIMSSIRQEFSGRRKPVKRILLDLESVILPSSMAVGLLLEMARLASSIDAGFEVATEAKFREILGMLKLDGRYTMGRSGRRLAESVR
ncbi:MAG: hypothetical protein GY895_01535 [Phycisphaera sp.]|nr:hypothetical protein [Phycisphaera sp.]